MSLITSSPEETAVVARKLGEDLIKKLPSGATLLFYGDLASGKTTFIKGLALAFGVPEEQVTSPTFVYLNIYEGLCPFYHFDLWRLKSQEEFLSLGFDEFLEAPGIKCLEWSERLGTLLKEHPPKNPIEITMTPLSENRREIIIRGLP